MKHNNKKPKSISVNINKKDIINNLNQIVYETAEKLNLIVLEIDLNKERGGYILRIFIHNPAGTVSHAECVEMTRSLSDQLDNQDFIDFPYSLEVSSPGINRKLKNPIEFEVFKGKEVKIVLKSTPSDKNNPNTYTGELLGLSEDHKNTIVKINDENKVFNLENIKTIQLEG